MILISHRGNLAGKYEKSENHPEYIQQALQRGFDVEVDVRVLDENIIMLGHDEPQYEVSLNWLKDKVARLWLHCKNIEALLFFKKEVLGANYFWHENDTVTLTSQGYVWCYPGKQPIRESIAVLPELYNDRVDVCAGICSDYILNYIK